MNNPQQREKSAADSGASAFDWGDQQHRFLFDTHDLLLTQPNQKSVSRCLYLAHKIQQACQQRSQAVLSVLQLNANARYQHMKELYCGVLVEWVASAIGIPASHRLSLICAALTQDVGMLDLQDDRLDNQATGLTEMQRQQIRSHPLNGAEILRRAGVSDKLWLGVVERHHERLDGSGYPRGLAGKQIDRGSRILALADNYVAMARPRGDRAALAPKQIVQQLFQQRGVQLDPELVAILISLLGAYPPGSWVRLASGEVAVVLQPQNDSGAVLVAAVLDADGSSYEQAIERNTAERQFAILEAVSPPLYFNLKALLCCCWDSIQSPAE